MYHFTKNYWYINLFNWFNITYCHLFKTMNAIKGVFISLQCKFWYGKRNMLPIIFIPSPAKILDIQLQDVEWKDKFETPRHEEDPYICITLFSTYSLLWTWKLPPHLKVDRIDEMDYWEQALWYLYYYKNISYGADEPDIKKARESWPWTSCNSFNDKGESTWNDKFLTNKALTKCV